MEDPISKVFDTDFLLFEILSFVTPRRVPEAHQVSSDLFLVSSQFLTQCLQNLRSIDILTTFLEGASQYWRCRRSVFSPGTAIARDTIIL